VRALGLLLAVSAQIIHPAIVDDRNRRPGRGDAVGLTDLNPDQFRT